MATVFIDGFDKYGGVGNGTFLSQEWTSVGNTTRATIVAALSATGFAFQSDAANGGTISKTLPSNYSRLIGGFRFKPTVGTNTVPMIIFQDVGTSQCSINLNAAGQIEFRNGGYGGGVIATSGTSVSNLSIHYLEWDITFGNSASYQLWLDGTSLFSGTADTTTTANAYSNSILLGNNSGLTLNACIFDDFYLFDTSGTRNNVVLNTSPKVETRFPTGDSQTQWTSTGANNWSQVDENPPDGGTTNVSSGDAGDEDLYSYPALLNAATAVYTVAVRGNIKRSDTGARTIDLRLKSNTTTSSGSNAGQTPGTTYGWLSSYFDADPNGNIAWTDTAVNSAVAGPKVAS